MLLTAHVVPGPPSRSRSRGSARRDGRQPLPLHGLHEDPRRASRRTADRSARVSIERDPVATDAAPERPARTRRPSSRPASRLRREGRGHAALRRRLGLARACSTASSCARSCRAARIESIDTERGAAPCRRARGADRGRHPAQRRSSTRLERPRASTRSCSRCWPPTGSATTASRSRSWPPRRRRRRGRGGGAGRGRVRATSRACSTPRRRSRDGRARRPPRAATATSRGARAIGDADAAMAAADVVVEETYRSQRVDHAYLEPEAGIGWIDSRRRADPARLDPGDRARARDRRDPASCRTAASG